MRSEPILKTFTVDHFKALTNGDAPGTFEAVVAVFGNVDRAGELIPKGAFADSLAAGLPPVVWSHDWATPPIGVCDEAAETDGGLRVKGRLFVADGEDSPLARQVWTAMKAVGGDGRPALREWSVGLHVKKESYEEIDGVRVTVLEALDLIEFGPCLKGVNPATFTVGVKALVDEVASRVAADRSAEEAEQESVDEQPPGGGEDNPEQRRQIADLLLS